MHANLFSKDSFLFLAQTKLRIITKLELLLFHKSAFKNCVFAHPEGRKKRRKKKKNNNKNRTGIKEKKKDRHRQKDSTKCCFQRQ